MFLRGRLMIKVPLRRLSYVINAHAPHHWHSMLLQRSYRYEINLKLIVFPREN